MNSERRWMAILAGRVLANALAGSLLTTATGAALLSAVGAIVDAFTPIPLWFSGHSVPFLYSLNHASYGALSGVVCGAVLGLVIFSTATFNNAGTSGLDKSLCARVVLGQCAGVCALVLFYFALAYGSSQIQNQSFAVLVNIYSEWLIRAAPALMICGAVAGALSKRATPKTAAFTEVVN